MAKRNYEKDEEEDEYHEEEQDSSESDEDYSSSLPEDEDEQDNNEPLAEQLDELSVEDNTSASRQESPTDDDQVCSLSS